MNTTTNTTATGTGLTDPCQNTAKPTTTESTAVEFSTAVLLSALEACWAAIRAYHVEVPPAVIILGPGSPARASQSMKWGHFASLRWQHGGHKLPEVLISGEGLSRTPAEVLTTLIHEAVHGLADTRGVKDTSRQGRYHNKHFAALARELGLEPSNDPKIGWSPCRLLPDTATRYADVLDELEAAMSAYRHPDPVRVTTPKPPTSLTCECDCFRRIRVARDVLAEGSIVCALCDGPFRPDNDDEGGLS